MAPSDSNASPERTDPSHPCPPLTDTEAAQAIDQHALKARLKQCRIYSQRAREWFAAMLISLMLGGSLAIPATASSAWDTWRINWQSNLILYFAGLCLVMCLIHFGRLLVLTYRRKRT